ncbi:hypothetical protein KY285_024571 [Solanum tuberosum]|nr:hypothetical protein KY285_024571 [Solanum tuberosum]
MKISASSCCGFVKRAKIRCYFLIPCHGTGYLPMDGVVVEGGFFRGSSPSESILNEHVICTQPVSRDMERGDSFVAKEGYSEPGHIPLIALFSLLYYVNPSVLVMAEADPLLGTSPSG